MISITTAQDEADLKAIITLQYANMKKNIPIEMRISDGFVTVQHRYDVLERMNSTIPSIIAKDADSKLIGYAISMPIEFATKVPELEALFLVLNSLIYEDKAIQDYSYYVMGQSCVAHGFRGQKILANMLYKHRDLYRDRYRLLITSISNENPRSLRAHLSVGFSIIHSFQDEKTKETWHILLWDWHKTISS